LNDFVHAKIVNGKFTNLLEVNSIFISRSTRAVFITTVVPLFAKSFYAELVSASFNYYGYVVGMLKRVQHKKDTTAIGANF